MKKKKPILEGSDGQRAGVFKEESEEGGVGGSCKNVSPAPPELEYCGNAIKGGR